MKPSDRISQLYEETTTEVTKVLLEQGKTGLQSHDLASLLILIRSVVEYLDEQHEKSRDDAKSLLG